MFAFLSPLPHHPSPPPPHCSAPARLVMPGTGQVELPPPPGEGYTKPALVCEHICLGLYFRLCGACVAVLHCTCSSPLWPVCGVTTSLTGHTKADLYTPLHVLQPCQTRVCVCARTECTPVLLLCLLPAAPVCVPLSRLDPTQKQTSSSNWNLLFGFQRKRQRRRTE